MKKFLIAALYITCLFSCSRKLLPANNTDSGNVFADSIKTSSPAIASSMLIVSDAYGRLVTPQQNLPQDAGIKYNNLELSKGFTTQQRANLQARYKIVPPRVLYVPERLMQTSLKGSYYVFHNKFWYWKKNDGLFYLDEKYYL